MKKILLSWLALLCFSISTYAQLSKVYLLSVGITDYSVVPKLKLPINDAQAIADVFSHRNSEVILLTNERAKTDSIKFYMRKLFHKATHHDIIIFFFSGHGYRGGFCPYDYNCYPKYALSYDTIRNIFKECTAFGKIIIADACHSGGLRTNKSTAAADSATLQRIIGKEQILLFLSSRYNEYSYELFGGKNSLFTSSLVKGLDGAADYNKNGKITAIEIYKYVYHSILNIFPDGKQHPVMWGNFNKGLILMNLEQHNKNKST